MVSSDSKMLDTVFNRFVNFGKFGKFREKGDDVKILKKGHAMRVIFFYPGEEGTYVDNAQVVLYENGIIQIKSAQEETTTHLQNCEILWRFDVEGEDRTSKVRLLKPKGGAAVDGAKDQQPEI